MVYLLFFLLVRVGVDLEEGLPHVTGHSIFQYVNQLNSAQSPCVFYLHSSLFFESDEEEFSYSKVSLLRLRLRLWQDSILLPQLESKYFLTATLSIAFTTKSKPCQNPPPKYCSVCWITLNSFLPAFPDCYATLPFKNNPSLRFYFIYWNQITYYPLSLFDEIFPFQKRADHIMWPAIETVHTLFSTFEDCREDGKSWGWLYCFFCSTTSGGVGNRTVGSASSHAGTSPLYCVDITRRQA